VAAGFDPDKLYFIVFEESVKNARSIATTTTKLSLFGGLS
jgi:hypothetical protein